MKDTKLWKCPKCGQTFVTKNLWHSCFVKSVDEFFKGKDPKLRQLYEDYVAFVRKCGPITINVNKTRISFQGRVRFAGVPRIRKDGIVGGFWLKRKIESPRFIRVDLIPPNNYVYQFLIKDNKDLDSEALAWIKEAYKVGNQEYL